MASGRTYDDDMVVPAREVPQSERQWVASLVPRIQEALKSSDASTANVEVSDGRRLAYTCEVYEYDRDDSSQPTSALYETDLLIYDTQSTGNWVPRVVVECKIGGVTTHDALTYSTKASTHKHVHPYLRYGFLAGRRQHYAIPGRLIRHGAYFDFMASWVGLKPTKSEWRDFIAVLKDELAASRTLQEILTTIRLASRTKYSIIHRPLKLLKTR
jgi:hypothetical protein